MRRAVIAVAIAVLLVLAGCASTTLDGIDDTDPSPSPSAPATEPTATDDAPRTPRSTTYSPGACAEVVADTAPSDGPENSNGSLLSTSELYTRIGTADCADDHVDLYYVDENGTWYHASLDGSVGPLAPEANRSEVAPVEFHIESAEAPIYVYRVHRGSDPNDCPYTQFYDAGTGDHLGWIPVPCPTPTPDARKEGSVGQTTPHPTT